MVYLFDSESKKFKRSEELSGHGLTVNKENRTVSYFANMGIPWNSAHVIHFDDNGVIDFTETTTQEIVDINEVRKKITIYRKNKNGKLLERKVDTTNFEGY